MGRKRKLKNRITYDSDEMRVLLGLVCLFSGIAFFLSYFIEAPVFLFLKNIASAATIFLGLFLINVSLSLFNSKFPLATKRSLLGQLFFVLAYSAFLNSIFGGNYVLSDEEKVKYGGYLGNAIYTFLSERLFLNFTPVFLFLVIIFSIPFTLAISLVDFLDKLGRFFSWLFARRGKTDLIQPVDQSQSMTSASPSTFGDFRRTVTPPPAPPVQETPKVEHKDEGEKVKQPKVEIREESIEGAYVNKELQYPDWKLPGVDLLDDFKTKKPSRENINKNADIIEQTLGSFGVKAKVVDVLIGPTVTQYALDIALGTKVKKISNLSNDLALALATAANAVRIEAPIPGTSYVGIEVPNEDRQTVYGKEILGSDNMTNKVHELPLGLGKNINGEPKVINLQKMPHMLIAGATGSGKSVLTNGFIVSLLMTKTPDEVKFIMVDPKQVELSDYNGIPHLLTPVITEMDKVLNALKWAIAEMERRYTIFRDAKVRNIEGYNKMMGFSAIPYIVLVIDEMADMMMSTNKIETEAAIVRLAQKARATGIHLLLATQRPSVDVITGLIKANIPGRVGMSVTTQTDSRVILDHIGAESLLGMGDMLYKDPSFSKAVRVQGFWISTREIQRIVKFIKDQVPEVHYAKEVTEKQVDPNAPEAAEGAEFSDDDQFANAVRVIVAAQKGSASLLQRKLRLGYNRAARLLDELEECGVVGPPNGSKPRDVLISDAEGFLAQMGNKTSSSEPV